MRRFAVPAVLIFAITLVAGCDDYSSTSSTSSSSYRSTDYRDTSTLANSFRETSDETLANNGYSYSVTSSYCSHLHDNEYMCQVVLSTGNKITSGVTVADDGESWRSHS